MPLTTVSEAKTLRREIIRIASDYDIEWKGELETLQEHQPQSKRKQLDIDRTIDEADELASQSEEQNEKDKAAQRKGDGEDGTGEGAAERAQRKRKGTRRAEELVD